MNHFLAIVTSIILVAGINNGDKKTSTTNNEVKVATANKYTLSSKTNRRPQTTNIIPATIVEDKYVAIVTTTNGDTVRYAPAFTERKIKF